MRTDDNRQLRKNTEGSRRRPPIKFSNPQIQSFSRLATLPAVFDSDDEEGEKGEEGDDGNLNDTILASDSDSDDDEEGNAVTAKDAGVEEQVRIGAN